MSSKIVKLFEESVKTKMNCIDQGFHSLELIGEEITNLITRGNKIMLCGNGGSAADAQHLAAEMLIRLRPNHNRESIQAIALAQDTSTITACGNDFDFNKIYERVISALGKKGDCLIAITTSGNSENVINAMKIAKKMGISVYGFLGNDGGRSINFCDHVFLVPSKITGRIQEAHITAGHALMEYVEDRLIEIGYLNLKNNE